MTILMDLGCLSKRYSTKSPCAQTPGTEPSAFIGKITAMRVEIMQG